MTMSVTITNSDKELIIRELMVELSAQVDGSRKNLICRCPFCGKDNKFGIYIGSPTNRKPMLASHCFSCGKSYREINHLLLEIGRGDLVITTTADLDGGLNPDLLFSLESNDEIEDELMVVEMPDFYRRLFTHPYLAGRGFGFDDFEYFQVGTTRDLNWRYDNYVIFPVVDGGDIVGYVARHLWSKGDIDSHNSRAKRSGEYQIRRFNNSMENNFAKLLYNYDTVVGGETQTVIVAEGIFDVVALTRKLDLYDRGDMAVVATFGKKMSHIQIFKLQNKGVKSIILAFDGDAVDTTKQIATELSQYFKVLIADIPDPTKDWDDLPAEEVTEIFTNQLKTPIQYKLTKI